MSSTLPFGIPATEMIRDSYTAQVCSALRSNVMQLYGAIGDSDGRAVLVSELVDVGVISVDDNGIVSPSSPSVSSSSSGSSGGTSIASLGLVEANFTFDARAGVAAGEYACLALPKGAVMTYGWYDVLTGFAGGGASISVGIKADDATGIVPTSLATGASWASGFHQTSQTGVAANFSVKTTDARNVIVTVSGASLTNGRFNMFLRYYVSV